VCSRSHPAPQTAFLSLATSAETQNQHPAKTNNKKTLNNKKQQKNKDHDNKFTLQTTTKHTMSKHPE